MILAPDGSPARSASNNFAPRSSEHAFDAAKRMGFRGYFWFPSLDPGPQMPQWSREEIAMKVNWLYNNVGAVRLMIDGLALDEVDTGVWPKATTENPAFNTLATDRFHDHCGEAKVFHTAAVENFYTAQFLIRRHIRLHGELFGQFVRNADGSSPMLHFIPPWQIRNATTQLDQSKWVEGGMYNDAGRALQWRVVTSADRTKFQDVAADDMLHFHDHFWTGQKRGMSGLAPVVQKLFTIDDIWKAESNGVLLRSLMAYAITRKDGVDGDGPVLLPNVVSTEEVETPDGKKMLVQKIVAPTGNEVSVANLPAGHEIKVLESTRAQEPIGFNKELLTDCAYCTLYPPEYVFFIAGMAQGTLVRLAMRRVQTVKNTIRQFQLIPQFCVPTYRFMTWQGIRTGAFDKVGVPKDWFRAKHICPADATVDIGREGRLYDDRVAKGLTSAETYHGMQGEDAEDVEEDTLRTRDRRDRKLAERNKKRVAEGLEPLEYEDVWPRSLNMPSPPAENANAAKVDNAEG